MDDLISRQVAIDAVHKEFDGCLVWDESGEATANEIEIILSNLPSAQPDIIRCRDCKHWDGEKRGQFWYFEQCSLNQHIASCDDFCSFAERKTDE